MLTKLSCYRAKDTSTFGGFVFFDNNCSVLIKLDVRTVCTANFLNRSNDNGLNNFALLYNATGCCLFNGANHDITNTGIAASGTTENTDAHKFFCTGVVSDLH